MSQRIEELIQQRDLNKTNFFCGEFTPWVGNRKTKTLEIYTCPARCKRSGKCYGKAYFEAKPGKAVPCIGDQCPWIDELEERR
jgi:hypothetical protein